MAQKSKSNNKPNTWYEMCTEKKISSEQCVDEQEKK